MLPRNLLLMVFSFFLLVGCDLCSDDREEVVDISYFGKIYNKDPGALALKGIYSSFTTKEIYDRSNLGEPYFVYLEGVLSYGGITGHDITRDLGKAVDLIENSWGLGVIDSGFDLYKFYSNGNGVCKNSDRAMTYLRASAELGYIKSQRTLGDVYRGVEFVPGIDKNFYLSYHWYEQAAVQGDRVSALNLAGLLHEGKGVEQDDDAAFYWLKEIDHMDYGDEMIGFWTLGLFYENGNGTNVDFVQAYKYYDLISPAGDDDKARLEEQMTPEQIQEAIRLSRQWQEEHNIFVPSYYGLEYQEDGTFQ